MAPPEPKGPVREHDDPTLMVFGASFAGAATPQEDSPNTKKTPTTINTNNFFMMLLLSTFLLSPDQIFVLIYVRN
jgi:hypothetical protein